MRRTFLFGIPLLALLLAGLLWSQQSFMQDPAWVGSLTPPTGGAACSTPTNATVNEGFETPGYENIGAWAETGTVVDDQAMVGVSPPTNSCSYCFMYAGGAANYANYDTAAGQTQLSGSFWFYVEELPTAWGYTCMFELKGAAASGATYALGIRNSAGAPRLYWFDSTNWVAVGAAFDTNEWHRVQWRGNIPSGTNVASLDGGADVTGLYSGTNSGRYAQIGALSYSTAGKFYLDIVQWNYTNNAYIP